MEWPDSVRSRVGIDRLAWREWMPGDSAGRYDVGEDDRDGEGV